MRMPKKDGIEVVIELMPPSRSPQIRKPQPQGAISAMVSSAKVALREGKKTKGLEA
jgi:hypothetical protein